ncbi:MAG: tetratricopeptide repeat protein, partial [Cyanobacteria bacterium P01_C01_bin.89]
MGGLSAATAPGGRMTERLVADFLDWDEEELPPESKDEVLGRLFRGIANTEGAGWFFVQCSRQQGSEVVEQLKGRFGRVEVLELDRESESFYPEAMDLFETNPFDVLVVQGVDEALLGYEDTKRALGWDSADLHNYDSRDVPPLLSHFNQVRECLRDTVPRPVVFVVSAFVVRYLLLRAPDFYDWRAGTLTLPLDEDDRLQIIGWSQKSEFGDYLKLTERQRQQKIIELHQLIETDTLSSDKQSTLLVEEGLLFVSGGSFDQAVPCFHQAIRYKEDNHQAWDFLGQLMAILGRTEEAIASYDKALEIKPDKDEAWYNRGIALRKLERYEEAIASFDKALEIKPDKNEAWNNRGIALRKLERYEEAIASYDKALEIKPDDDAAWYNRGIALGNLERYEEAIASFDKALEIK